MKFPLSIATPLATLLFTAWARRTGKPNVVFIFVDDLIDWIGCTKGYPIKRTRHAP